MMRCPVCDGPSRPWGNVGHTPILRCAAPDCGFRFFDLRHWQPPYRDTDYYADWTEAPPDPTRPYIRARVDIVRRFKESGVVAELGCGIGETAIALSDAGFSVVGVEESPKAMHYLVDRYPAVSWENKNILDFLAEERGPFDAITLFHVLEHIPHPEEVVGLVAPRLARNGVVVIEVPDTGGGFARLHGHRWDYYIDHHVNYFDKRSLQKLMASVGLHCRYLKCTYHFSFPQGNLAKDLIKGALATVGLNSIIRTAWTR